MHSSSGELEPVELLADEFLERQRRGEKPTLEEYAQRHPELASEIREVFPALIMIEQVAPASGDLDPLDETVASPQRVSLSQIGDYRILRQIGRGGMGVVYEAEQQSLGRRVALKVLPRQMAGDEKSLARFQREARAAARMHHTNIVPVFDVGQDDEHVFYAMQLIQGQGLDLVIDDLKRLRSEHSLLRDRSRSKGRRDVESRSIAASLVKGRFEKEDLAAEAEADSAESDEGAEASEARLFGKSRASSAPDEVAASPYAATVAHVSDSTASAVLPGQSELSTAESNRGAYYRSVAQIGLQTAQALSYAHARGIIHRDIKPSNLLLDAAGVVWVTDFGLAKTGDEAMTHTGDILGTIRYMSPERFRGKCDVRADVYSLGLTLYELLVLKPAFESPDRLTMIDLVKNAEPPGPRSIDPRIPRDLETIVLKSIDKDPKRRYQSADELVDDLQRFVDDQPIRARRISMFERFARWSRRNKGVASLGAVITLLLVTVSVVSFVVAGNFKRLAADESAAREQETRALKRETEAREQASIAAAAAITARKTAEKRRLEADRARKDAEAARYVADMNFARTLWEEGSIHRLQDLLIRHIPVPGQIDHRNFEWHYWWRATHLAVADINVTGGSSAGYIDVSPDARLVCVARWKNRVAILDRETRTKSQDFEVPPGVYDSWHVPCFSSDGRTLYSAGVNGTIARFDTSTWQRGPDLAKDLGRITRIAVSPARPQMAIAVDNEIRILDTKMGKTLSSHPLPGKFRDMAFSPDGETLTLGLQNGLARATGFLESPPKPVWKLVPPIPAWKDMPPNSNAVARLAFSRDGKRLVTCGYDGVRLWDPQTDEPIRLLRSPSAVRSVALSPQGSFLAGSLTENNVILVWQPDRPNRRPIVIHGHNKSVWDVAFPASEDELWASDEGGKVIVWDLKKCRPYDAELLECDPTRTGVFFLPDGRQLAVGVPGRADSHDVDDIAQKKLLKNVDTGSVNGRWSVDWTAADKTLRVWDLITGKILREWPVDFLEGRQVAVSRDGSTVAWARSRQGDADAQLAILRLSPDSRPQTVAMTQDDVITQVTLSPDGRRCAVRGNWDTNFWDLSGPKPAWVRTLENFGPDIWTAFSPDGKLLAVASWNNDVRIHDAKTGELLRALRGHSSPVRCLVFSPDGKTLISGSDGGAIKLWDPHRGELRTTLRGHVGPIYTLDISPDGRFIASYGADRWLRVWRGTGTEDSMSRVGKRFRDLGNFHLYGNWFRDALDDFQRASILLPEESYERHDAAYRAAFLLVHFERIDDYRALCRRIAAEYANTDDFQIQERTLKMCAFSEVALPTEVRDVLGRFAKHVAANLDRDAKENPSIAGIQHWIYQALGIAAYRLGNYAEAESRLRQSNALFADTGGVHQKAAQTTANLYYLALAAHRAGRTEDARKLFAEANAQFAQLPPDTPKRTHTDWIVLESARREAEALINDQ